MCAFYVVVAASAAHCSSVAIALSLLIFLRSQLGAPTERGFLGPRVRLAARAESWEPRVREGDAEHEGCGVHDRLLAERGRSLPVTRGRAMLERRRAAEQVIVWHGMAWHDVIRRCTVMCRDVQHSAARRSTPHSKRDASSFVQTAWCGIADERPRAAHLKTKREPSSCRERGPRAPRGSRVQGPRARDLCGGLSLGRLQHDVPLPHRELDPEDEPHVERPPARTPYSSTSHVFTHALPMDTHVCISDVNMSVCV